MDTFKKAFNRERSHKYVRGGRQLSDLSSILENGLPEYILYYLTAQKYYEVGNLNEALKNIEKSIPLSDIDDWKQYAFKANVLEEIGNYDEAINSYEIAIDINGNDIYVYALYHQIGWCYLNLRNDKKAVEFYSYAIDLKKSHPNSEYNKDLEGISNGVLLGRKFRQMYVNRGNSHKNLGKLNDAKNDCLSAIEIDPNYSNPYLLLYQIYDFTGQNEKSIKFLKKSALLGNNNAKRILNELGINQTTVSSTTSGNVRNELE